MATATTLSGTSAYQDMQQTTSIGMHERTLFDLQVSTCPAEQPRAKFGSHVDTSCLVGDNEAPIWDKINQWLSPRDSNQDFWWSVTGRHLATMLHEAGYPLHRQYEYLLFHYYVVVPRMGPEPTSSGSPHFKSFMTGDFSPVQYSWQWGNGAEDPPEIRLSVELIGPHAGTALDPYNQTSTVDLLDQMHAAISSIDVPWFKQFLPYFQPHSTDSEAGKDWGSSLFTAYALGADGAIGVKAYFVPRNARLIHDFISHGFREAIQNVQGDGSSLGDLSAFSALSDFMTFSPDGQKLQMVILGIDCVVPAESRMKVYMRTPSTSLAHVISILSLGGRKILSPASIAEIKELWHVTLGIDADYPEQAELPSREHETSGLLFYFDIKPRSKLPDVKLYIPVRHYGKDDASIARGLLGFLEKRGRAGVYKDKYLAMLRGFAGQRKMMSTKGLHTYISFAVRKDGGLLLRSYLSSQIYERLEKARQGKLT
ncbi:hypothetical protein MMC25_000274 [Agyrium rufum]|nr:hypothetical protein [Agyrium rufum]